MRASASGDTGADLHQLVLNVASVCEKADKATLKRLYDKLRRVTEDSLDMPKILQTMSDCNIQPHDAYNARWSNDQD